MSLKSLLSKKIANRKYTHYDFTYIIIKIGKVK